MQVKKPGISGDIKLLDASAEGKTGAFSLNNSSEIGLSGKFGPAEVEGSMNLGHAIKGATKLMEATIEYVQDKASGYFDSMKGYGH